MKKYLLILILFFGFLSGCSRLDLAVRWADTFVMSSVTDYFDLTSEQDARARGDFRTALRDVKKIDFPILASHLEDFALLVEKKEVTDEKVDRFLDQVDSQVRTSIARFETMAQNLLDQQSGGSYEMFDAEFSRKHEKDLKEARDDRAQKKKVNKNIDRFVGETVEFLTEEQQKEVDAWIRTNPPPLQLQLESRKALFDQFKSLRADEKKRRDFIRSYFTNWIALQTPAYQKARMESHQRIRSLFKKVLATITEKQRKNLVENFRFRAKDFRAISLK